MLGLRACQVYHLFWDGLGARGLGLWAVPKSVVQGIRLTPQGALVIGLKILDASSCIPASPSRKDAQAS